MKILTALIGIGIFLFAAYYAIGLYMKEVPQGGAPALPQLLDDGEYLGFIHAVDGGSSAIQFDDAVWLVGTKAQDAAIAAGLCTEETREECTPNGYFIQNALVKDELVFVHPNARVIMATLGMEDPEWSVEESREIALTDFATLINDPARHWLFLPYRITILDGVITQIEEVYIP
jgi:hypothetical protein